MATLGDKVTETIISALGKGIEGAGLSHHDEIKAIIQPRIDEYLNAIPEGHPLRGELEHLDSNTTIVDMIVIGIGFIFGIGQMVSALGQPWGEEARQRAFHSMPTRIPDINTLFQAYHNRGTDDIQIHDYLRSLGYGDVMSGLLWKASRRPLPDDYIRDLYLRQEISEAKASQLLEEHAYPDGHKPLIKALWQRIPPVNDLIRMAVREAFTPEIAQRFGQYEDFPAAAAEWAAKQGLSAEWTQRYWAAHWELPSVTQGFEMLHRGVISDKDMELLLRAQDVMPFWRDKIKAIAYAPLTRVDIRRMYHLGVLNDAEVVTAYKELGYNETNSRRMLEFTKQYYGPEDEDPEEEDRELTKAEILDGYRKRILTTDQARTALREMSYPEAKIDFYLAREDLKADQARKDAYITRWRNLYINGIASADDVYSNLGALGVGKPEVDELLPLWHLDKIMAVARPTKAEITRWLKAGIITEAAWTAEMQLYGYSDRHISWYLAEIKSQPELAIMEEEG